VNDSHFQFHIAHPIASLKRLLWGALFTGCCAVHGQTVSISGLYRTGVDNSGVKLGGNVVDNHYVLTAVPGSAPTDNLGSAYTVLASAMPGQWEANHTDSRWITTPGTSLNGTVGANGSDPRRVNGDFDYTLTFTMPAGAILSTVSITGYGWADNTSTIRVNGTLVSGQSLTGQQTADGSAFTLSGSNATFVSGSNTITFRVNNTLTNTGLLISSLSGTVSVPEVGAMLPIFGAITLYGLVAWRRRAGVNVPAA
jgi:hypothetical protein